MVNVSCSVDSSPPASVVWRHEDTGDVVSSGQHLLLTAISRTRAGCYICEATNRELSVPGDLAGREM